MNILAGWWNWLALISFDRGDLWDPGRSELVGVSSLLWDRVLVVFCFWWLASISLLLGLFTFVVQVWDPGGFSKHNSLLRWWHAYKVRSFESFRRQLRSCTTIECLGDFCSCVSPSRCVEVFIFVGSMFFSFIVVRQPICVVHLLVCPGLGFHINHSWLFIAPVTIQDVNAYDCNRSTI